MWNMHLNLRSKVLKILIYAVLGAILSISKAIFLGIPMLMVFLLIRNKINKYKNIKYINNDHDLMQHEQTTTTTCESLPGLV